MFEIKLVGTRRILCFGGVISIFCVLSTLTLRGQSGTENLSKVEFNKSLQEIGNSLHSLYDKVNSRRNKITPRQQSLIDSLQASFMREPNRSNKIILEKSIAQISFENDIKLEVKFTTKNPDAEVRYKSIKDTQATPCDQRTNNCTTKLPIGKCQFWSERNGKRTSQVYEKTFDEDTTFEIVEDQ